MAFQVRIRINKNVIEVLSVASSSEEFEKFTIGKLKEKTLSLYPGVSDPESLRVIYGQDELEDHETFESCRIEHLSLLVVVLRMPGGGAGFRVRIRINRNTIKVLSVASSSEEFEKFTIGKLKEKALSLFPGVNDSKRLGIIYGQDELEDHQTFKSRKIEHLSLLVVVLRMPEGQERRTIFVKTPSGKTISVDVGSEEELENITVEELRRRIDRLVPGTDYRLLYRGRELEDHQTLRDYGITHKSTVHMLLRLRRRASKLQKDISMDLIMAIESVIESLNITEMRCSDLMEDFPASTFTAFHDKILQMKQNCDMYKLRLMKKLGFLLPNIRGDLMKETDLNDLLQEHDESPFRGRDLAEWLKERERESNVIKSVLRQLKDAGAQVEDNIDLILMDLEVGNLICYTFTSLNCSDVLLLQQKVHLNPLTKGTTDENSPDPEQKSWLTPEIQKTLRSNLKIFKNFIDSKDRKPAKFIVSSKEMKNNPGSCILLYESECDEAVCFIPPSKPACPITEEIKDNSVDLKVPPSCPETVELRILYKHIDSEVEDQSISSTCSDARWSPGASESPQKVNKQRNLASVEELLEKSLRDLLKDELKRFQWYLMKHEGIPKSEMENADVLKTVDMMVARSGPEEAVKITADILRKISQNNLAEHLENKLKEARTEGNMKASSTC